METAVSISEVGGDALSPTRQGRGVEMMQFER